jgi:hypothetical protein
MISPRSSAANRRSGVPAFPVRSNASLLTMLLLLAACSDDGIVEPGRRVTPSAGARVNAGVVVTANYSEYDSRAQFNGAGVVAHLSDFEEFTGGMVYQQETPWTSNAITYTSSLNIVLGPAIGLGVQSNAMSTEYGAELVGQFSASDAFTMFGADLALIGVQAPFGLVVTTNLATYTFTGLDIPLAAAGQRFLGLALSQPGEYFTGFRFTNASSETTLLLDNVAVGHVAAVNADPVASVGSAYAGAEGSPIALALSATDADSDVLAFSWDLGDGTTGTGAAPPSSHTYADNGTYDIMLAVADGRGGVDTARTTATVSNVAPTVAAFTVPTTPIALTGGVATVPISTTFSDPGSDSHVATLDCGTGVPVQSDAPNGTAGGTCTFSTAGVYAVRLTVLDDDGDSDTEVATGQVVVYVASTAWITGGGWIDSPAGAYTPAASVTGKLTFEFVARYQSSSASNPSGSSKFELSLGKLDFESSALDWLIVSGSSARLQGNGTLNGAGDYGFSLLATDGAPDAIRIRIWNRLTGVAVYDNKPGLPTDLDDVTPLGGGSIQVHAR